MKELLKAYLKLNILDSKLTEKIYFASKENKELADELAAALKENKELADELAAALKIVIDLKKTIYRCYEITAPLDLDDTGEITLKSKTKVKTFTK